MFEASVPRRDRARVPPGVAGRRGGLGCDIVVEAQRVGRPDGPEAAVPAARAGGGPMRRGR